MTKIHKIRFIKRVYIETCSERRTGFLLAHAPLSKTEVKQGSNQHQTL